MVTKLEKKREKRFWEEMVKKYSRLEWTEEEREHYRRTGEKPLAEVRALTKRSKKGHSGTF
ncbi:MAG: hypothetical protein GTN76_03810 [Candidatus Aenigmarchaeota archaeon]|nr:hypothetical protein [Candidatus Aenigmarchaeota archaeon]